MWLLCLIAHFYIYTYFIIALMKNCPFPTAGKSPPNSSPCSTKTTCPSSFLTPLLAIFLSFTPALSKKDSYNFIFIVFTLALCNWPSPFTRNRWILLSPGLLLGEGSNRLWIFDTILLLIFYLVFMWKLIFSYLSQTANCCKATVSSSCSCSESPSTKCAFHSAPSA